MSRSLQDQLLKSGIATERQAKKARAEQHSRRKQKKGKGTTPPPPAGEAAARKALTEKAARDRALNLQRQEEARRRGAAAEVRQLIESNRLPRDGGEVPYHFVDGTAIKRLHLPPEMHRGIVGGQLALVRLGDGYEVVPAAVAGRIGQRDPAAVVPPNDAGTSGAEDDAYADFPVPDDLMW